MKSEAYLFAGVAAFFLLSDIAYAWFAREPAGMTALAISFLMASVIAFFSMVNYRRKGARPEDRSDAEIQERSGRVDFFPPHSRHPVVTAVGATVVANGVVYGDWLVLIGLGILGAGVFGMAFQYNTRRDG
ncbi:aa3-type cytochrome oxidase subunit IV [Streptomyces griseofuscus]|uniref:aa3-type cytochrome oxidase subunit IV n=1 Tax=Streptomyces griseofuscus TaxID=146922 RepID=UPI0037F643E5